MDKVQLVKATWEDRDLLYEWTNEEEVRKNSIQTHKIEYKEHIDWFFNRINKDDCDIFIYYIDTIPAGQIRLDYKEGCGWISFSIDRNYRGQGHGGLILKLAEEEVQKGRTDIFCLAGIVKRYNIASQKKFVELNYTLVKEHPEEDLLFYQKMLIR
jgi:spore coat polysaccharide biosynthesis protein SpsF